MKLNKYHRHPVFSGVTFKVSVLDPLCRMYLDDAFAEYITDLKIGRGKSPRTIEYKRLHLGDFIRFTKEHDLPKTIQEYTPQHIKYYLGERLEKRWSLRAKYLCLHAWFNWAIKNGYVQSNPVSAIDKPDVPDKMIPTLSQDEIGALFSLCDTRTFLGRRNLALLMLFLETGLRLSEMCSLKMSDKDLEGGYLKVKGKGDKERIVAFGETAKSAFWGYLRIRKSPSDMVWLTEEMKPLTVQGWKSVMRRIVAQAGITKKCGTHTLRHTFAVNFLRAGGDIRMLQILLGHADIKMSQHYSKTLSSEDAVLFQKKYSFMDTVYKKGQ